MEITDEQIRYAKQVSEEIHRSNREFNDLARSDSEWIEFIGYLGETVYADKYDLPRPERRDGLDDGYDFYHHNARIDLKTTEYTGDDVYLKMTPERFRRTTDVDRFVLLQLDVDNRDATIALNITRSAFKYHMERVDLGYGPNVGVRLDNLPDSKPQLVRELTELGCIVEKKAADRLNKEHVERIKSLSPKPLVVNSTLLNNL